MQLRFSSTSDYLIGTVLTVCCVIGILGNIVSLYTFYKTKSKGNNSTYFKHVYLVISLVNLLLCAAMFPVIDSAFSFGELQVTSLSTILLILRQPQTWLNFH